VGCGAWGKLILRDLVALGAEVTVVARSQATIDRAQEGGAHRIVGDIHEATDVSGVIVAVPTSSHAKVLTESLAMGVPVFVEKPLTNSIDDAMAFTGRTDVFVMDKWRYHPGIETIREMSTDGRYGRLRLLRTTRHGTHNPHMDVDAIWILAPHDLAIVLEITGDIPKPLAAIANSDGTDASLVGLLDGHVVVDVSSKSNEHRRQVVAEFDEAVVTLSDGYANALEVRHKRPPAIPERIDLPPLMPLELELRAFLEHLIGGPPPRSSADEGILGVQRIAELRQLAGL
jgi:predicted dehydrogenase